MAFGTPDITVSAQLATGPKMVCGTVTAGNGDTTGDIDLSAYFGEAIKSAQIQGYKAAAYHDIDVIDFATTPTTLTITFADPTAAVTFHFMVMGY